MLGPPTWNDYVDVGNKVELFGDCLQGGFAKLHTCDKEKIFVLPRPEDRILSGSSYFYFAQVAQIPNGILHHLGAKSGCFVCYRHFGRAGDPPRSHRT